MRLLAIVLLLLYALPGMAHEVRPGYLEVTETAPERYQVLWKVPMKGDAVLRMSPLFPETCTGADTTLQPCRCRCHGQKVDHCLCRRP